MSQVKPSCVQEPEVQITIRTSPLRQSTIGPSIQPLTVRWTLCLGCSARASRTMPTCKGSSIARQEEFNWSRNACNRHKSELTTSSYRVLDKTKLKSWGKWRNVSRASAILLFSSRRFQKTIKHHNLRQTVQFFHQSITVSPIQRQVRWTKARQQFH